MLRTRNREDILLFACLAAQQSVVIDNTNPTAGQRARYALLARAGGFSTALYFFETPLEEAVLRNSKRPSDESVPDIAVRGTFAKLEPPTATEPFDHIFRVTSDGNDGWKVEEVIQ